MGKEPNDTSISGKREEEKQKVCRQPLNMVPDVLQYEQWWETLDEMIAAKEDDAIYLKLPAVQKTSL